MKTEINDILRFICKIYFVILNIYGALMFFVVSAYGAGSELLGDLAYVALFVSYIAGFYYINKNISYNKKRSIKLFVISLILIVESIPTTIAMLQHNYYALNFYDSPIWTYLLNGIPGVLLLVSTVYTLLLHKNVQ